MTLAELFALTPEEHSRLKAPLFQGWDETRWAVFAGSFLDHVLTGYQDGEISLRDALTVVRCCALGCKLGDRIGLLAMTVERALRITPKFLNRKRPPYPTWLRNSAVTLVHSLHAQYPDLPVAANQMNQYTTPILATAIETLTTLDLWGPRNPVSARTLDKWRRKHEPNALN